VPAASPVTDWLPLVAELLIPVPVTDTEVALALDHVTVVDPGELALVGLTLIDADTLDGALTVTVWVIVAAVAPAASTALAVNVTVVGPVSVVALPELPSVPLPPPARANAVPFFHTFTCVRLPSASWP